MAKSSTSTGGAGKGGGAPESGKTGGAKGAHQTTAAETAAKPGPETASPGPQAHPNQGGTANPNAPRLGADMGNAGVDPATGLPITPVSGVANAGIGSTDQPGEGSRDPEQAAVNRDIANPPGIRDVVAGLPKHPNDPLLHVPNDQQPNPQEGGQDVPGDQAAKATANLPPTNVPLFANAKVDPLSPQGAFPGEETKTMISPRDFRVQLPGGRIVQFTKGPQEVPASLQEHPYVRDHGVKAYNPTPAYPHQASDKK